MMEEGEKSGELLDLTSVLCDEWSPGQLTAKKQTVGEPDC